MSFILVLCENPDMDFDLQPTLRGRLLELRPLNVDDFEALYAVASDPLIWEQHPEPLRYQRDVFQKYIDGAMESKGAVVVHDLETGKIIGCSRFYEYKPAERVVKIGYTFFARAFWGKGYNTELKTLMLDHAFQWAERVLFEVGENNIRSQIALQRIGARLVGREQFPGLDGTTMLHCLVFSKSR
jgi:RimJ/RimL family protein N-acetyltransferase